MSENNPNILAMLLAVLLSGGIVLIIFGTTFFGKIETTTKQVPCYDAHRNVIQKQVCIETTDEWVGEPNVVSITGLTLLLLALLVFAGSILGISISARRES